MSRLDRLTQWQSGGTSLRKLERARKAGEWTGDADASRESDYAGTSIETDLALGGHREVIPSPSARGADLEAEVGETMLWGDDDADDAAPPMEALPVYRSAGQWVGHDGDLRVTVHGFASESAYARGECVLGQGSLWQESAAISLLSLPPGAPSDPGVERQRRAIHDVRPHLLLLLQAQDMRSAEPCVRYGASYLRAWCIRNRLSISHPATNAAAMDGLTLVYRCRELSPGGGRRTARLSTPSIARRAREFAIRTEDYARVRAVIAEVYQRRFDEAAHRFLGCADYVAPKTGFSDGCGYKAETWWHPERLPPVKK